MAITLLITDDNLAVQGDPLTGWTDLDATLKFNEPGAGSVTLPAYPAVMEQLQPGNRLVLVRDGAIWMAGPMEQPTDYSWSVDSDRGVGTVTVNFSDDLATIAGHITWPEPALAWAGQHGDTWRTFTATNAETIIRTLVNENCGPGAIVARRIPQLVLDTVASAGTNTALSTRFEPVLEACRRAASAGGLIGFRTRQDGTQIKFGCYTPADKSATARFSVGLGNLRGLQYSQSAPTATHALVAGNETAGSSIRTFVEVADTGAAALWWRVEHFIDGGADNDSTGELTAAGTSDLAESAAPVTLATVTVDTEGLQAGRDYTLGDKVAVALPHGLQVTDIVRAINLQASAGGGEQVASVVGSQDATTDPQTVRLIRTLSRKVGRLETR
ncbi:siphovirus ReqiPepy6 Gp37-like family protein [Streptomyces sp. ME02-8801-2C]|uniref:siphovirus ReqiPepy6 Gp37-like family protein n=1 Tax=Streptomyces sp. ME02-8801-2C TaxID=3028680 RepID=UPI0029B43854|nr:siphovirus ReqiPepy6 Gp37-like family protein [Streptomyces sp. ME02-8801-2C]MDX3455035.1 siphovirus ReqiPepy6 Gp37-like family protein [Streptomyces sp. ME02-8801-2C]